MSAGTGSSNNERPADPLHQPEGEGGGASKNGSDSGGPRMSFLEHLEELRRRLFRAAMAVLVGLAVSLYFSEKILDFLLAPITSKIGPLAVMKVSEAFMNKMKAGLFGGIVLALPVIFFQLWRFVSPGLYRREKRWVFPVVFFGTTLFLLGGAFCYLVGLPITVTFLADQAKNYQKVITIDSAFSFSAMLLLGTGAVFELPLVIFALAKLGLVTPKFLLRKMDIAVFIIFVVAAVITPTPDMITQTIFALPMIGLYLVGILVAWIAQPKARPDVVSGSDSAGSGS